MFSVVIPLYNKEDFIEETVESVLNQSFLDFEILVIDDGSTDDSVKRLLRFKDSRLRIMSKENGGVASARNYGISLAVYDWIAFLDGDDWWDKAFLNNVSDAIGEYSQVEIFVTGRSRVFEETLETFKHGINTQKERYSKFNYYDHLSIRGSILNSSNTIVKKSLLVEAGLFPEGRRIEDLDTWFRICARSEVILIDKVLSYYRKLVKNSATSRGGIIPYDFKAHLETLLRDCLPLLTKKRKSKLRNYIFKFVIAKYAFAKDKYNREDRSLFKSSVNEVLQSGYLNWILRILDLVPVRKSYIVVRRLVKGR